MRTKPACTHRSWNGSSSPYLTLLRPGFDSIPTSTWGHLPEPHPWADSGGQASAFPRGPRGWWPCCPGFGAQISEAATHNSLAWELSWDDVSQSVKRIIQVVVSNCLVTKSCLALFWPSWTVAHQAPLSMGFPRHEYWSGYLFPSPGDLPDPGIKPMSPALGGGFFITEPPGKPSIEASIFWPPKVKSRLIGKDPDAGKDWRQKEKGVAADEMARWHHRLDG